VDKAKREELKQLFSLTLTESRLLAPICSDALELIADLEALELDLACARRCVEAMREVHARIAEETPLLVGFIGDRESLMRQRIARAIREYTFAESVSVEGEPLEIVYPVGEEG
jgi:hypothetical protein